MAASTVLLLLLLLLLCFVMVPMCGAENVLFVGNSYTYVNSLDQVFANLWNSSAYSSIYASLYALIWVVASHVLIFVQVCSRGVAFYKSFSCRGGPYIRTVSAAVAIRRELVHSQTNHIYLFI